ncbi:hypothetical protein NHJ13734_002929 [Beauveria thailandica]
MEGETTRLSEVSLSPNPTSRRAENAFLFPLGDLTSDGEGVFAAGDDGSSDRYNNYEAGGGTSEPQWATFTSDFSVLLHTPDAGPNHINELGMDRLAGHSFGSSGLLTPDEANLGGASHGSSPPHRRWSNFIKPLGVQEPLGVQGVLMTTQVINIVEDSLANKSQSLEMLLGTIQKAIAALNGLIGLHHHSDSQRCLMLFPVVLHQVAELMEVAVESLDAFNWQTAAEMSGTAASNSILERLDSLNDLISSYHPATTSPHRGENKVRRWTRRLEEGLDASLMTVGRLMELDRACRARGGQQQYQHEHATQSVGGCAHLQVLAERFHHLRRRLSELT